MCLALLRGVWLNGYFRGAVSGLGVLDLWIALGEVFRLRRFSPSTPRPCQFRDSRGDLGLIEFEVAPPKGVPRRTISSNQRSHLHYFAANSRKASRAIQLPALVSVARIRSAHAIASRRNAELRFPISRKAQFTAFFT